MDRLVLEIEPQGLARPGGVTWYGRRPDPPTPPVHTPVTLATLFSRSGHQRHQGAFFYDNKPPKPAWRAIKHASKGHGEEEKWAMHRPRVNMAASIIVQGDEAPKQVRL
ncbi:hypothetical protein NQZ68_012015 [Dissostichus eleginoides]|nr:hypothetical protein NQZ68_012015 [Dissostichus eleginoides]